MTNPWDIYDELIEEIPADITVTSGSVGLRWCTITSSEGGLGIAYTLPERSRPTRYDEPSFVGARLRDIAALAKSWNFAEAGVGMAAVNAWYARPDRAEHNGFTPCTVDPWQHIFDPFADDVAGRIVSVIGHFPFAPAALGAAADLRMLERCTQPGDYPDPACEYLLPESDFVFVSGSAFANKTMPRLLELAQDATTVIVGPSTPLSPALFDHGVDVLSGFVSSSPTTLADSLGGLSLSGMFESGHRVERARDRSTAPVEMATV